jgi:hypothetical protein
MDFRAASGFLQLDGPTPSPRRSKAAGRYPVSYMPPLVETRRPGSDPFVNPPGPKGRSPHFSWNLSLP